MYDFWPQPATALGHEESPHKDLQSAIRNPQSAEPPVSSAKKGRKPAVCLFSGADAALVKRVSSRVMPLTRQTPETAGETRGPSAECGMRSADHSAFRTPHSAFGSGFPLCLDPYSRISPAALAKPMNNHYDARNMKIGESNKAQDCSCQRSPAKAFSPPSFNSVSNGHVLALARQGRRGGNHCGSSSIIHRIEVARVNSEQTTYTHKERA